jgi:hypothetical protein
MARFVCSMNVSLDGYVDHDRMAPDPQVFRFWINAVKRTPNCLYGRKIYQLMTYWQDDGLALKMWRAPTEEPGGVLWETGTDRRRSFGVKQFG